MEDQSALAIVNETKEENKNEELIISKHDYMKLNVKLDANVRILITTMVLIHI